MFCAGVYYVGLNILCFIRKINQAMSYWSLYRAFENVCPKEYADKSMFLFIVNLHYQ